MNKPEYWWCIKGTVDEQSPPRQQYAVLLPWTARESADACLRARHESLHLLESDPLPLGEQAVRIRIEHGPEVSREFVEKYANRISIATTWNGQNVRILKRAFREAGVTVKEKK